MNDVFETFQELLRSPEPNYSLFRRQLMAEQAALSGEELVRGHILMRLNWALDGFAEQRAGTSDVSILLRQAIHAYERRLEVKRSLWQVLSSREQALGLHATAEREPDMVERMTVEIANALQRILNPKGVAVIVEAKRMCSDERALRDLLIRYPVFAERRLPVILQPEGDTAILGYPFALEHLAEHLRDPFWDKYHVRILPQMYVIIWGRRRWV